MPKCNFSKVAMQLYWNCTSAWVFSRKFAAYFQNTFSQEHLWIPASEEYTSQPYYDPLFHITNWRNIHLLPVKLPSILQMLQFKILNSVLRPEVGIQRCSYKRCPENMQQIYKRTPMPKCDFNKFALQLYWSHTLAQVFSCKFAAYFHNTFY